MRDRARQPAAPFGAFQAPGFGATFSLCSDGAVAAGETAAKATSRPTIRADERRQ